MGEKNKALLNGQAMKNYFLVTGNNTLLNGRLLEIRPC